MLMFWIEEICSDWRNPSDTLLNGSGSSLEF